MSNNRGAPERLSPDQLTTMKLFEIADRLSDMQDHQRDTVADGGLVPKVVPVTDEPTELLLGRWLSMTVYNDGASAVAIFFNYTKPTSLDAMLASGENLNIDKKTKKPQKVYLCCSSGNSASVRMWVLY